jgi:hypothetical protein
MPFFRECADRERRRWAGGISVCGLTFPFRSVQYPFPITRARFRAGVTGRITPTLQHPFVKNLLSRLRALQRRDQSADGAFPIAPRGGRKWWLVATVMVSLVTAGVGGWLFLTRAAPVEIASVPYSDVAAALAAGTVSELTVEGRGTRLVVELMEPMLVEGEVATRVEAEVPRGALELADLERWSALGTRVWVEPHGPEGSRSLSLVLSLVLFAALVILIFRLQRGPLTGRRFLATPQERHLTLADVGGAREAQADLRDVIAFLKDPAGSTRWVRSARPACCWWARRGRARRCWRARWPGSPAGR